MGELIIAVLTVVAALAAHFTVWKISVPKRQTRAILMIFFSALGAATVALPQIATRFPGIGLAVPVQPSSYLHIMIFVTAAALSYMITYTVVEVDSPSLVMALAIRRAGEAGLPEAEFHRMMDDALLVEPRIRDMLRDGLVRQGGGVYELTPKGRRMARLFMLHRSLLGAGKGG